MPSCNTYNLTWVSLTLGMGYLFTAALAKHSQCSLSWTRGISSPPPFLTFNVGWLLLALLCPHSHHPLDLGLLLPATTPGLRHGVAPPSCRPWPWMQGSSSRLFLHLRILTFSATAPDLGRGVTPLGSHPLGMEYSWLLPLTSDVG